MTFIINNRMWHIEFVNAASEKLHRSDGSLTVGVMTVRKSWNREDITGQTFGYLTAIGYDHFDGKSSYWKFRCKCGNTVIRSLKKLREAKTPSCGCYAEEIKAEAKRRRDEKESKSKYYHENAKCNRNLEGNKIGKLKVIKLLSEKSGIDAEYLCRCDCGNAVIKKQKYLINTSNNHSCGCGRKNAACRDKSRNRLLGIYRNMIYRCYNKNSSSYKYYGEKGITVNKIWLGDNGFEKFYQWAIHNGYNDELTIDRINPNGNYTPENCRWADAETQANNKTNNIHVQYEDEVMTLSEFCRKLGLDYKMSRLIIQNDCVFSGEYIEKILQKKTNPPL